MSRAPGLLDYDKGYSIALLCLGAFFLLGALQIRFLGAADADATHPFSFISNLLALLGLAGLTVSLLRWMRFPLALPMTAALSIVLLIAFPIGTILSLYWLTSVRQRESVDQGGSEGVWFNYTVALYIGGLMFLDAALVLRFVLSSPGPESRVLELLTLGFWIAGLAALAIGALRSVHLRAGHLATLIFNSLLVLWVPLGTGLALIWFFAVRKHEKVLLAQSDSPRPIAV